MLCVPQLNWLGSARLDWTRDGLLPEPSDLSSSTRGSDGVLDYAALNSPLA